MYRARAAFGAMGEVVYGRPPAEVVEQIDRSRAARALPMVSGALNRETSEPKQMSPRIPRNPRATDSPVQQREILQAA